jgi:hypothetical protein
MGTQAQAGTTVEGCDPRVMTAMQATAQARIAASKAIDDEIYDQDDSVLAMTCFNKAAAVSAQQAGMIFSGDFTASLAPVVEDALGAMYNNFTNFSIGGKSGAVDYTTNAVKLPGPGAVYDCTGVSDLWSTVNGKGVKAGVPYVTFDDLVNGATATQKLPGGNGNQVGSLYTTSGTNFKASWNSPNSVSAFNAMQGAVAQLPTPSIPSFAGQNTPCDVLVTAGALPAGTACP